MTYHQQPTKRRVSHIELTSVLHKEALDLVKDIDFSSSFDESSFVSENDSDGDSFDPADLEGLFPQAKTLKPTHDNDLKSTANKPPSQGSYNILPFKSPRLIPDIQIQSQNQWDISQVTKEKRSKENSENTLLNTSQKDISSPLKVNHANEAFGMPAKISLSTNNKRCATSPLAPENLDSKSFANSKKLKFPEILQTRNFSTNTTAKSKKQNDNYHTLQLATQRPNQFSNEDYENDDSLVQSTKELKNVKPIILSREQEYVLGLARKGHSIFFTGSAGTGKSVLLRSIIKSLKQKFKPELVAITASTGLAACNIGGVTVHSFAGIGLGNAPVNDLIKNIRRNRKALSKWSTTEVLVIDEISMIDGVLFNKLDQIGKIIRRSKKPFGGIQIVACGDFYQLPPVNKPETLQDGTEVKKESIFAFESSAWNETIESSIILKEVFRQKGDQKFIDMLNDMRTGIVSESTENEFKRLSRPLDCPAGIVPTQLYATRYEVDGANNLKLNQINGEARCYNSIDGGTLVPKIRQLFLANFLAPQRLFLKKGAQVMCIKNFDETLVNGSLGQVVDFLDRDTYMCQNFILDDPDMDVSRLKEKLGLTIETPQNEVKDTSEPDDSANASSDYIFQFLDILKQEQINFQKEENELFWENSQRKKKLIDGIKKSSTGEKYPLVRFLLPDGVNTRDVLVEPETWSIEDEKTKQTLVNRVQLPLMLAWALSIHKSQGQTLPKAKVDLSRIFENGQAYVALSRAVSRDGLQVLNFRKEKVTTHYKVQAFYETLKSTEDLARIPDGNEARSLFTDFTSFGEIDSGDFSDE